MWSDAQIEFVISCLTAEQQALSSSGSKSTKQAVRALCDAGLELIDAGVSLSPEELAKRTARLASTHPREEEEDPLKIQALLAFEVGYKLRKAPSLSRREFFTANGVVLASSLFGRRDKEEAIAQKLEVAQNARWMCNFSAVDKFLVELDQAVLSLQGATKDFWWAKVNDLRVESLFTTGQEQNQNRAEFHSVTAIAKWHNLRKPVELLHAYLRNAVLERQQYLKQGDRTYLHNNVETLNDALNDQLVIRVRYDQSLPARNALFSLFSDTAKSYAMVQNFSLAKTLYRHATRVCNELEELAPRRELDLLRTHAIILEESLSVRPYPRDYILLDELITRLKEGIKRAEQVKDIVLHEIMQKDLIPLLILTGKADNRAQAESIYCNSFAQAIRYGLHHQMRGLLHISQKYNLRHTFNSQEGNVVC